MIKNPITLFICFFLLSICVFAQGRKFTKEEIEIIKQRDQIKNSKIKTCITYKCFYDLQSGTYLKNRIASRKTYNKDGNMTEYLSFDANGKTDHATRISYDDHGCEILRTDSTKDGVNTITKKYTNNLVSEEDAKSGSSEKKSIFVYKFNNDGFVVSKKIMDQKNKPVSEETFTYDKFNKLTQQIFKDLLSGGKTIKKFDANENETEYIYFSPETPAKIFSKVISVYDDSGILIEEKDLLYDTINITRKYIYDEGNLSNVVSNGANGSMGLWSTYKHNDLRNIIEEIDGYENQPAEKITNEYEYFE
jgi:hypothetical protein